MAFTEAERVRIRGYLGFPDVYRSENHRLESALDVIGSRVDVEAAVRVILADLTTAETALATASSTVSSSAGTGGLKKVDEVEFYQATTSTSTTTSSGVLEAKRRCRMLASRLSITIGVPMVGDYFGAMGYQGDGWMGIGFQGGMMPMG